MPIAKFKEPFLTRLDDQLIPDVNRSFFSTAKEGDNASELVANVGLDGRARLDWVIDHDGRFFEMISLGLIPRNVVQLLRITKQKELIEIQQPRAISVGELRTRTADIEDRFEEARFAAQTRRLLRKYPEDRLIDEEIMIDLLGE